MRLQQDRCHLTGARRLADRCVFSSKGSPFHDGPRRGVGHRLRDIGDHSARTLLVSKAASINPVKLTQIDKNQYRSAKR
jgi:hypothetical protein